MNLTLRTSLAAIGACLPLLLPGARALAAGPGASSVTLNPVCVTKAGAALFFFERSDDCGGAARHCRGSRWAWAALKSGSWEFEGLGEAALDDESAPESNAQANRQLFKAPASHVCVSYLRAPKLVSPDLPDSDSWFQYSFEKGELVLRWQSQKVAVGGEVKLWRAAWSGKDPKVDAKALDAGLSIVDGSKTATMLPAVELALGSDVLLGFPEPKQASGEQGFLVVQATQAKLRQAQASLLLQDARRLPPGDLLTAARAAGLLDAALQLEPGNAEARMDYARLLARQGEPAPVVRELDHLKATAGLKAKLAGDKAFDAVRAKDLFKRFVDGLK